MWQSDTIQWRRWSPLVSLSFRPARPPTHHGCWFCFLSILNLPLIVYNFISPTHSLNNPPTDVDSGGASATQAGLQRAPLRLCWETYPAALSGAWGDHIDHILWFLDNFSWLLVMEIGTQKEELFLGHVENILFQTLNCYQSGTPPTTTPSAPCALQRQH